MNNRPMNHIKRVYGTTVPKKRIHMVRSKRRRYRTFRRRLAALGIVLAIGVLTIIASEIANVIRPAFIVRLK